MQFTIQVIWEAYELIGNPKWLDYSTEWANHNHWTGATEPDTSKWVYKKYGEDQQHVLFGDWQICFRPILTCIALIQNLTR